jgi:O-antigen biosynthesis protein
MELAGFIRDFGYELTVLSPCRENAASAELNAAGIRTIPCAANDSSVAALLAPLPASLVIYDRFVMEEQFGWRARALWPEATHVVDTQDLHSVRRARERLHLAGRSAGEVLALEGAEFSPDLEREMASLLRADACFVVSFWEREWLIGQGYPGDRVFFVPFSARLEEDSPSFAQRRGFAFLGNFRHPPNLDAVFHLARTLWPQIRSALPNEKLHLYGAYPPQMISELHGKNGIIVDGFVANHRESLYRHRVLLAPLRFGAGIKGKVLEAYACGMAVVGSDLAFEGIGPPGVSEEEFATTAARLHEVPVAWEEAVRLGRSHLAQFQPESVSAKLEGFLAAAATHRLAWRSQLVGRMLRHFLHNSTKYFSQWIEAKNK